MGRGDFSSAGLVYEKLTAAHLNDSFAVLMLAHCYEQQNRLPEALCLAEEGARQLPESLDALKTAVRLALANEEHEKATSYLQRALALPEVRTEIPRQVMPRWLRWSLAGLFRLPILRTRIRRDALAEFEPGKGAMELQSWKRWALEYLNWRNGQPPSSFGGGGIH